MIKIENIIKFKNVSYQKPSFSGTKKSKYILKNITLNIKKGEFVSVMGANGCGKSTLAKHFNGLLLPSQGDVIICGKNTKNDKDNLEIKKNVGMIFQNPESQIVACTVEEEIAFGMENLCFPREKMKKNIKKVLQDVNLTDYEKASTYFLSGGEKQRLAIASVLAMEPKILVLDEPTSMLDNKSKGQIFDLILKLNKEKGITVVLITHFINEAVCSDRTVIMNDGSVAAFGNTEDIISDINLLKNNNLVPPESACVLDFLKNKGYSVDLKAFGNESCAKQILKILGSIK
ncbi:MAG: energy-coupling factor transporter ATPase [Clostridia bacterium]|nr:energy-coupling factor transporter ATPase [Clostridia bacterium]